MIVVYFNSLEEYLSEMQKDGKYVFFDSVVRCTEVFTPTKINPNIKLVEVKSQYIVLDSPGSALKLVQFTQHTGDYWGVGFSDDSIVRAQKIIDDITDWVKKQSGGSITVRPGSYKEIEI